MTTFYAVLTKDFEYDDERYRPQDGGKPKRLFRTKEKADSYVIELTVEAFRKLVESNANSRWKNTFMPFDADYDYDIFAFRGELGRKLDEVLAKYQLPTSQGDSEDFMDFTSRLSAVSKDMSDEELGIVLGSLQHPLFEVYAIEADEEI